jgi:hypothetical protein
MKMQKRILFIICMFLYQGIVHAQDKLNIKFGKVSLQDFSLSVRSFDTSAEAVVIADIGNTSFEGNNRGKGDFSLVYKRFKRIKIISKSGFDVASEEFIVYSDGYDEEKLTDLKASCYNIENDKVMETKLDDKSVFTEKIDRYRTRKKFTIPAVKEGSIVEVSYTIKSDFYTHLRPWNFQGEHPILWSEYEVHIPKFFNYVVLSQGDQNFLAHTTKSEGKTYNIRVDGGTGATDFYSVNTEDLVARWVKKDVPALKEESFTTTIFNHVARVEFQLNYIQFSENGNRQNYLSDWTTASEKLLKSESFGVALDKDNHWMSEALNPLIVGIHDDVEKMRKIFSYVRDNISCKDHDALYANETLKTVFKNKSGNVAEVNLLLVAMLRHENIDADPVVLSTRDNGYPSVVYPLMERFNYVVCTAHSGDKVYYLDASRPVLGFGQLAIDCYNGPARVINKEKPFAVYFEADSLKEAKQTAVMIFNDEKGKATGSFESTLGYNESFQLREKIKKMNERDYFKDLQTNYGSDFALENTGIDSLSKYDLPVKIHYDFNIKSGGDDDIIYFNPMLSERYKENPFKAAERKYPVEMPYRIDELYTFSMEIPDKYEVEELPKSAKVAYNESEGSFEYLIQKDQTGIQMRCRLKLNKANFLPDDYGALRDFFGFVVKKESEQIVFKKKK